MYTYYGRARIRYYGDIPKKVWTERDTGGIERLWVSRETQPADPTQWKDPPHLFLANLRSDKETGLLDLKALQKFTQAYGALSEYPVAAERRMLDPVAIQGLQELLQRAWRGEMDKLDKIEMETLAADTEFAFTRHSVEIQVSDLWTLIRILFLRDYAAGRAKVCGISDCPRTPYFLQARKGQKFCSHPCAVLANVRRFRQEQRKAQGKSRTSKSKRKATK